MSLGELETAGTVFALLLVRVTDDERVIGDEYLQGTKNTIAMRGKHGTLKRNSFSTSHKILFF